MDQTISSEELDEEEVEVVEVSQDNQFILPTR
jgi:hypothetical protein